MKADPAVLDQLRAQAYDALHSYAVAACDYELERASVVFKRTRMTLENQINGIGGRKPALSHLRRVPLDGGDSAA